MARLFIPITPKYTSVSINYTSTFYTVLDERRSRLLTRSLLLCSSVFNKSSSMYTVTPLVPPSPLPTDVVQKFKALRLEALRSAPAFFSSKYSYEAEFTEAEWSEIICHPTHHVLICEEIRAEEAQDCRQGNAALYDHEWVGMLILCGPLSKDEYMLLEHQHALIGRDDEETRWHLAGLYIQSGHRCRDTAVAIHEAILDFLRCWTDDYLETLVDEATGTERLKSARITGVLRSGDPLLTDLYQALGGSEIGWVTRADALRMTDNEGLLRILEPDEAAKPWLAMERVVEC